MVLKHQISILKDTQSIALPPSDNNPNTHTITATI